MRVAIICDYEVDEKTKTITFNWYDPEDAIERENPDENYVHREYHTDYCMLNPEQKAMYMQLLKAKKITATTCVQAAFDLRSLSMDKPFLVRWSKHHKQWVFN